MAAGGGRVCLPRGKRIYSPIALFKQQLQSTLGCQRIQSSWIPGSFSRVLLLRVAALFFTKAAIPEPRQIPGCL